MATAGVKQLPSFNPSDPETGAPDWELYKRDFLIHLDALGLDDKPGRRKVGVLLSNMGREAVKIYDSFEWAPRVEADDAAGIEAVEAEDKYDLETVFKKFDRHFGVHNYRNIKRQEFLNTKRGNMTIMDYISELKRKAEHCQYNDQKEGFICDMIINGVNDSKCSEKLMEIPTEQLSLERVMSVCRQVELTNQHLKSLGAENPSVNYANQKKVSHQSRNADNLNQSYCKKCCKHHQLRRCPAYNKFCDSCGEKGHFKASKICRNNGNSGQQHRSRGGRRRGGFRHKNSRQVNYAEEEESEMLELFEGCSTHDVFVTRTDSNTVNTHENDWKVTLKVGNSNIALDIDSGAMCNVLSKSTAEKFNRRFDISHSDVIISGVSGNPIKAIGKMTLPCRYKSIDKHIEFQVVDTNKSINLLGRDDSVKFGLIARVNSVEVHTQQLLTEYSDVIGNQIGCVPGTYEIKIDNSVTPVIHAPRPVPAAIRDQLKKELDHLQKCDIIAPVEEPTEWVNSMVCVRKKNGRVRICIDPSDLNKAIKREHFPMNSIDDISTRLHGSKYFSVLDANQGYYQIRLNEKSSHLTTFNTPFGRYRYLRMPMGISCASEVFQRELTTHFGNLEGVEIVVDDILVHGSTLEEHDKRLRSVLNKARQINLKLNKDKCEFAKPEVVYVGHKLTGEGIKPTDKRISAIINMKEPENHGELETILGMLAYVTKFIPNLSELNAPLRELKKQDKWLWESQHKTAFENIKKALTSTEVLRYFDVNKPVRLTVDASMKGLGAAIIQENGVIAYASRALSPTEQRYAQIEKEMLAVVFGCEHFHKFLYGKSDITIESDHKPLENLLKKPIHSSPMRIQRMLLKLQPYQFNLIHVKGKELGLADCLSRLYVNDTGNKHMDDELMVLTIDTLSCNSHDKIREATNRDQQLVMLKKVISQGWPETKGELPLEVIPFWDYREEISMYNGVVYRGERVCIPLELREETLKIIHNSHMGSVKCKQRARELVFWPGMSKQIEEVVNKCSACLLHRNKSQKEPMIIGEVPELPWSKVGTDLFELDGNYFLIMVDYYSNFIEVSPLQQDTKSRTIIKHLKENIARYGIMDTLISDNGPQYTSAEFKDFTTKFKIKHITSSPLHQQSNGLAEKAVQTVKRIIKKCAETGEDIYLCLLELRNTPRDNEMGSPMQRLMGRRGKSLLPITTNLRKPESKDPIKVKSKLFEYRVKQKHHYDKGSKAKDEIKPSDAVRIRTPDGWKPAELIEKTQYPRSYKVKAGESGREYRRNTHDLMKTKEEPHKIIGRKQSNIPIPIFSPNRIDNTRSEQTKTIPSRNVKSPNIPIVIQDENQRSRFGRVIKRPKYLEDYQQC